ncbi:hypothetical protein LCGC14_1685410 [marine sediment metagenome]|uniref:Uncharacterized protein n=1 Tax=marine sediment metagenome TaxID=412755 RepID=A0A0F9I9X4_9ZZZZ
MPGTTARFINIVKITEIKDIDYIVHLINTFSGESWVFKIYKDLWESAMEIRKIDKLSIITSKEDEDTKKKEDEDKKKEKLSKVAKVYI